MKSEIKVPAMGESISTATISAILKPSGSVVQEGEGILELETDKVNQELYAPVAGELDLKVKVGDKVIIGQIVGSVDTSVQGTSTKKSLKEESPPKKQETPSLKPPKTDTSARQTPSAFVESLTPPAPTSPPPPTTPLPSSSPSTSTRRRMSGLRRTIAQRLVEVKNQTAMLTTFNEVDMTSIIEIRAREKESFQKRYGVRLGFMSFFVKASVAALKAFPDVNSYLDGDDFVTFTIYDIGVAVSTEKGLFVPVIRKCDTLSFGGIESAIETYAKKAKEGTISVDDLRGGGFTITNGGIFGSLFSTPILNPPQSAILGMHTIAKRAVVVDDQIVIRPMMYLALSYDHRVIDGKEAVQFLVHMKQDLENPARLLLDL